MNCLFQGGTCINDWDCFCSDDLPNKNVYCEVKNNTLEGHKYYGAEFMILVWTNSPQATFINFGLDRWD